MTNHALIVIDVQNEYVTVKLPISYPDLDVSLDNIGAAPMAALGVPIAFSRFREHHHGTEHVVEAGLPAEGSIIEPAD